MRGLSPVAVSGGHSSSRCVGLSLSRSLLLRSTGSRRTGSAIVAHGPSCSAACGIFPDQGSNPCPLHWQADSQPLRHQGSPHTNHFLNVTPYCCHQNWIDGLCSWALNANHAFSVAPVPQAADSLRARSLSNFSYPWGFLWWSSG